MSNLPRALLPISLRPELVKPATLLALLSQLVALVVFALISLLGMLNGLQIPLASLVIPLGVGLVHLVAGLYVFRARYRDLAGQSFGLFTAAAALAWAGLPAVWHQGLTLSWAFAIALAGGSLFNLALVFPQKIKQADRFPSLRLVGYLPAFLVAVLASARVTSILPTNQVIAGIASLVFLTLSAAFFLAQVVLCGIKAYSPIVRERSRLVLVGFGLAFLPLAAWGLLTVFIPGHLPQTLLLFTGIFPWAVGFAILGYRTPKVDALINLAVLYGVLSIIVAAGYTLLVAGLSLLLGSTLSPTHPAAIGLMVFLLVLLLNPLRMRLQRLVDIALFRRQAAYHSRLEAFEHELVQAMELASILNLLRQYIQQDLQPTQLHIFVYNPLSGHYQAAPGDQGQLTSDLNFLASGHLVQSLSTCRNTIYLQDTEALADLPAAEKARLAVLGCPLLIPMPGRQQLIGWLALSQRRSTGVYDLRDLDYLEALRDQAALAIERAQVVEDLERRIREMNVLTRVAQGTNFTIAFDDILELIYTQTSQIIPTRDFRIVLFDRSSEISSYAFYLEDDERLNDKEQQLLPDNYGLEAEVIRTQRGIITNDYPRECRVRGIHSPMPGVKAWMGVPLNGGADTVGAIGLGRRDSANVFTSEQLNLLQAIADQSAGAIVKARLMHETERRAHQLATLNEIGRGLTSTLELKPLLERILLSATEILNCAAGSLFLVDEQSGELVFEVVIGPVAEDLVGKRLPPGAGLVGEAVETGLAIVANNAKRRKQWFEQTDQQTGFDTQDLLVVPMLLKDRVIGVIEVINKQDGLPFTQGDQELLTTFTSQATIAIENARLYTLTDRALAARVEELSVMQRIDRELNASLNIERAMRITLGWSLRQSEADAGLLGFIDEKGLRVMASQGYNGELAPYEERASASLNGNGLSARPIYHLPSSLPGVHAALHSGLPQQIGLDCEDEGSAGGLLVDACKQIVIPMRGESEVMGVLLLESRHSGDSPDDLLVFLTRLCDHAAIAITNAQLYEEVQSANVAKSKFVSFVAHELKNPMASIKGYTELVAGGMAGPVNEMQSSFLATVRSNVDRMNTIVSDLNDLTKIQVGSLRLEYKAASVQETVNEAVRSLRRQIDEKNLALILYIQENLPQVWADPARLGQILTNLLSNAQKYSRPNGQIVIGVEQREGEVEIRDDSAMTPLKVVHFWVEDQGIGIPAEDQDKVFNQYFRTEASKEFASGTGLGLNITKSLVEMQGGKIWFESELNRGTTFHFTIPQAE